MNREIKKSFFQLKSSERSHAERNSYSENGAPSGEISQFGNMADRIASFIVIILSAISLIALLWLSLRWQGHCDFEWDTEEVLFYRHAMWKSLLGAGLTIAVLYCLSGFICRLGSAERQMRFVRRFVLFLCVLIAAVSFVWTRIHTFAPVADQLTVWRISKFVAEHRGEAFSAEDYKYLRVYPHQKSIVLVMALVHRIFGDHAMAAFKTCSCICSGLLLGGLSSLTWRISRSPRAVMITSLLTFSFVPLILYTTFVYGTYWGITASVWGLYFVFRLCEERKARWVVPAVLALAAGIWFYKAMEIFAMGAIIALLFAALQRKKGRGVCIAAMVLVIAAMVFYTPVEQKLFYAVAGGPVSDGLPSSAWIAMGLTSTKSPAGSGGFDNTNLNLYRENNKDPQLTDAAAREMIRQAVRDFASGKRDARAFFTDKTKHQWIDEWFGGITMTCFLHIKSNHVSSLLRSLITGRHMYYIQDWLSVLLSVIYASSLAAVFRRKPAGTARIPARIMEIVFFGGFLFQMFWECKSRYCLPYYLCLFPLAGIGIVMLGDFLTGRIYFWNTGISMTGTAI